MAEETVGVLERAATLAKESLNKIEAPAKAQAAEAQAKSDAEKQKTIQVEKEKETKLAAEQAVKTKEDERILVAEESTLKEEEKKRKTELLDIKRKQDDTPDAKIKRVQEASQKRIDEIKSEMLAKDNKTAQEFAALKAELDELKKPRQQEDIKTKVQREHVEQIAKFVEEDKSKPKEQRREMTKDELDTWYLEDPTEATAWINRREIRRDRELLKAEELASKPLDTTAEKQRLAKEFVDKQNVSRAKLIEKFPSIIPSKEKIAEIRTKLGLPLDTVLNQEQLNKFNEEFAEQNSEYKLLMTICRENPKTLEETNGPELVMAEMEKRLGKTGGTAKSGKLELTQAEIDAKVEAEIARRKLVDEEGITSTRGGKPKVEEKNKSELRQKQEAIAKKAGISVEQLDKSIARRDKIPGAGTGGAEE